MIKLDYSLETPEERNQLVEKILAETPADELNNNYLEILSNYLILCMEKQEKKQKKILTENRLTTVNKRETSFLKSQCAFVRRGLGGCIQQNSLRCETAILSRARA